MSELEIDNFYGLYSSTVFGNLILIDPLLPPKRCLLDCISCPVREGTKFPPAGVRIVARQLELDTSIFEEKLPTGIKLNGVLVWGFGDPLTLTDFSRMLLSLRFLLDPRLIERRIYVHTSLLGLLRTFDWIRASSVDDDIKFLVEQVDGFIVPFLWYGTEKHLLGWPRDVAFSAYLEMLRAILEWDPRKLLLELHLFKVHEAFYPERFHVDELVALLRHIKAEIVVLKPVDRPSINPSVKPVPESYVERLNEYLIEEGFKVLTNKQLIPSTPPQWKKTARVLYNHILRMPLKYVEIRAIYGDLGIIALNNLLSKNLTARVTWGGEVYFVSR